MGTRGISPQTARTTTNDATSVAKKTGNTSSVGDNRAYSNGRSEKDECSDNMPSAEGRGYTKKSLCYRCG